MLAVLPSVARSKGIFWAFYLKKRVNFEESRIHENNRKIDRQERRLDIKERYKILKILKFNDFCLFSRIKAKYFDIFSFFKIK